MTGTATPSIWRRWAPTLSGGRETSSRSLTVHFSAIAPGTPITPQTITHIGDQGAVVTVNGLNFHPDATVQVVHAQSSRTLEVSTSYVSASQFMVTIPSTAGCGVYYVTVYNPNTLPASNSKGIDYCPSNVLNVLSYNVAMLPDIACGGNVFCQTKDTRAPLIARHPDVQGHDVIIFQEAFADSHRETMVEILSHPYHGYVYYTQVLGSDDAWEQDGGVIILSRWPIENGEGEERTFGDACYGDLISGAEFDCLADKGVLYARINKLGQRYHIFGTHLDAGGEEGDRNAREQQLKIIAGFMSETRHIRE